MHVLQIVETLRKGHQAMVFVHSRKDTGKTARTLAAKAQAAGDSLLFDCSEEDKYPYMQKDIKKSRNRCGHAILSCPSHFRMRLPVMGLQHAKQLRLFMH